jgi:hypothetical protein
MLDYPNQTFSVGLVRKNYMKKGADIAFFLLFFNFRLQFSKRPTIGLA